MEDDWTILTLNEYCLLEILKHLSVQDLANFKEAYQSVGTTADREFSRKTRGSLQFNKSKIIDDDIRIIKEFGTSIVSLELSDSLLRGSKWSEIASALQLRLRLKSGYFDQSGIFPFILSHCENLKELELNFNIRKSHYSKIFKVNKSLSMLQLHFWLKDTYLGMIVDSLLTTRLEELSLRIKKTTTIDGNIFLFNRLPYLKRLSVMCSGVNVSSILRNGFQSLNVLCLSWVYLDEAGAAMLSRMNQLSVLSLRSCSLTNIPYVESLLVLCGNGNLQFLTYECFALYLASIDEITFLKLIQKRKESAAERCLHLCLNRAIYDEILEDIPFHLLNANKGYLRIE